MTKKFVLAVVLIVACLALWILGRQNRNSLMDGYEQSSLSGATNLERLGESSSVAPVSESQPLPTSQEQGVVANTNRYTEVDIRSHLESQNVPIEFYGKVIDQDDNPLPNVKVRTSTRHWDVIAPIAHGSHGRMIGGEATSSLDGHFVIQGMTGDSVSIETIEKPGYELEPTYLTYGATSGSLESPVIFCMWNTNIHEQLISENKTFPIVPDGRSYVVNLQKGVISESKDGHLRISVKRPENVSLGQKYDWSCRIEVLDGGLQAASNSVSKFKAPTDGYVPMFTHEQKVGSGWGDSTGKKEFFVKLNNGQIYGFITIELFAYYNNKSPGMVRLHHVINPSGSRVLK